jgi:hypothetical protein
VSAVLCGECDDAPATTGAWFNGRTWIDLCDDCFAWWENHALTEPAHVGTPEPTAQQKIDWDKRPYVDRMGWDEVRTPEQ